MYHLKSCRYGALRLASWPQLPPSHMANTRSRTSPCDFIPDKKPAVIQSPTTQSPSDVELRNNLYKCLKINHDSDVFTTNPDTAACFDITKVTLERGNQCHSNMIRLFLYTHYWPREPSVVGLWMSSDSPYLDILTDKYSNSGDRFLAFEKIDRTQESRLIGVSVANKVFPWMVDELEEWANCTFAKPDRTRMYFMAHCLKHSNLIKKYNTEYIYDVEVLGTDAQIAGRGVGKLLLDITLHHAEDLGYPVVQVIAINHYASKICEKCGMKLEWSMNYQDYVDRTGHQVFFPRRPHTTVGVYSKFLDSSKPKVQPCKPQFI